MSAVLKTTRGNIMIPIIAKILGSGDVISKGMELIDDAFESEAEKRESKTNAKIALMKAYAPFKVAQRYLALLFSVTYVSTYVLVMIYALRDIKTDAIIDVVAQFKMDWIMMTIIVFYFGGGLTDSIYRGKKKNKVDDESVGE